MQYMSYQTQITAKYKIFININDYERKSDLPTLWY